jgi:hypothetical protein
MDLAGNPLGGSQRQIDVAPNEPPSAAVPAPVVSAQANTNRARHHHLLTPSANDATRGQTSVWPCGLMTAKHEPSPHQNTWTRYPSSVPSQVRSLTRRRMPSTAGPKSSAGVIPCSLRPAGVRSEGHLAPPPPAGQPGGREADEGQRSRLRHRDRRVGHRQRVIRQVERPTEREGRRF